MEQFIERLDDIVFLDIKKETLKNIIHVDEDYISLPILTERIMELGLKEREEIPTKYFIEGIFYALGVYDKIKNHEQYMKILENTLGSINYIKGEIYTKIKEEKTLKAYFLLRGLFCIEKNIENYDKLSKLCFNIVSKNNEFIEEMKKIINIGKNNNYITSYLYESYLFYHLKEYENSKKCIEEYLSKGGKLTPYEENFKQDLWNIVNFNLGKEKVLDEPNEALKLLVPLIDDFSDDPSLLYYIAQGYRKIGLYEKAIYYLKEAEFIDRDFLDVLNELGLNYALLGLYNDAILYFERVYLSSKSIESINNLILCYHYTDNGKRVRELMDEGLKIYKDDEIFLKTIDIIKRET